MPRPLEGHNFPMRGRNTDIPFEEEWLDGTIRQFVYGEDFTCTPEAFRRAILRQANKRNIKVTTDLASYPGDVVVQAVGPIDAR